MSSAEREDAGGSFKEKRLPRCSFSPAGCTGARAVEINDRRAYVRDPVLPLRALVACRRRHEFLCVPERSFPDTVPASEYRFRCGTVSRPLTCRQVHSRGVSQRDLSTHDFVATHRASPRAARERFRRLPRGAEKLTGHPVGDSC
jgi:hypothetical protein